jgi:hypothetical protein
MSWLFCFMHSMNDFKCGSQNGASVVDVYVVAGVIDVGCAV